MKHYKSGRKLSEAMMSGVDKLADAVGATLGPRGRNVVLKSHNQRPLITKDGVTVARFVEFEDPFENLGAQVIKQASEVTNSTAGDWTTTATLLARAILLRAQIHLASGASPVEIKKGILFYVAGNH